MRPMSWAEDTAGGCWVRVRVTPRSSRNQVDGPVGDALKVRLQAPPVEGKANAALVDFLAGQLEVPRRTITLDHGAQGRSKRLLVTGLSAAELRQRLGC